MKEDDHINEMEISMTNPNSRLLNTASVIINRNPNEEKKRKSAITRKIIGYIMLLIVIILTVVSSIWIKKIGDDIKPFILTYINYSFLTILIGVSYIKKKIIECFKKNNLENEKDIFKLEQKTTAETFSETIERVMTDNRQNYEKKFHQICISLTVMWYFGNAFYNYGLTMTSITSANSLSNLAIIFIFIEKIIFFKSKCTVFKIVGTFLCISGVAMMGVFESSVEQSQKSTLLGDGLVILGAFTYSIYANLLSYYSKKHKHHFDMMEVFGYIGFYTMIIFPFVLIVLNLLGIENSQAPSLKSLFYIFLNALVAGMISDLLLSYSITYLSPHVVSFGMTLTIPLSYLYDFFQQKIKIDVFYIIGSALIMCACVVIFVENYIKYKRKKNSPTYLNNTEKIDNN